MYRQRHQVSDHRSSTNAMPMFDVIILFYQSRVITWHCYFADTVFLLIIAHEKASNVHASFYHLTLSVTPSWHCDFADTSCLIHQQYGNVQVRSII